MQMKSSAQQYLMVALYNLEIVTSIELAPSGLEPLRNGGIQFQWNGHECLLAEGS